MILKKMQNEEELRRKNINISSLACYKVANVVTMGWEKMIRRMNEEIVMKRKLIFALIAGLFAAPAFADPVVGLWQTEVDDGAYAHVKFEKCADKLCGTIAQAFNNQGPLVTENQGKPIVWDMVSQGDGKYRKGRIWQPSTGKIYKSKMQLDGDILTVSGCVGPICKKQRWLRVK